MVVDGTGNPDLVQYVVSNNNGTTKIKNSKIIAGPNGVALDAYYWPKMGYEDVVVDVENTEIIGSIEVTVDGTQAIAEDTKHELSITGGTLAAQTNGKSKIYNEGTLTLKDVDMIGNTGADAGSAIYNITKLTSDGQVAGRGIATINNVNFKNNSSVVDGGAIYNEGTLTINGGNFENNRASQNGWGEEGYAGAIFDKGELKIVGTEADKVSFEKNIGYSGGAIYGSRNTTQGMTITNAEFEDNHALADAGALGIFNDAKSVLTNVDFEDNTVAVVYDDIIKLGDIKEADGGGAIQLGQLASATLNNVHFEHNISGVRGGAISARHFGDEVLEINNSDFEHNISYTQGGAIANAYDGKVVSNTVEYVYNIAYESGGAIYNGVVPNYGGNETPTDSTGNGILEFAGVNRFENNHAGKNGGAIFNGEKGTVIFNGTNTFVNNTVGEKYGANDIHNLGSVTVASGTTKLSGGVTGNGTFTIDNGAELYIGSSTISQGSIVINGDVYADVLTDGSSKYIDRADKEENVRENNTGTYAKLYGNVSGNGSINLNVGTVGTYKMFNKAIDDELADNITAGKAYDIDVINGTDVKVTLKSVENLATDSGLSQKAAGAISSLASSSNRNIQMVSLAAQKLLNSGDVDAVAKIEQETAKLNPEDKPVTQSVATSLNNQVLSLTAGRMSGGAPVIGRSGGDESVATNGFWVQGLYNKSKSGSAFDGTTRGFALGADTLIDNKYTLGAGFAYNNTDMSSGTRDTEIDSKTLFVYGQYKPSNWFANATLAYTMSEYTEDTDPFGIAVESTYDVDVYGAQLMAGYDFATGITPEMGLRYLHIAQDEYSNGVNTIAASDTDFLTAVAGLKYAFYVETENMLKFRPELRAALTYDVINDGSHTTVMLPSVGASYNVDGKALNKLGGEFGIGLTAEYKGLEFSLMYDLDVHEDYTSQTGMIKFRSQS
jgi:predicted outer membrane repeat protein